MSPLHRRRTMWNSAKKFSFDATEKQQQWKWRNFRVLKSHCVDMWNVRITVSRRTPNLYNSQWLECSQANFRSFLLRHTWNRHRSESVCGAVAMRLLHGHSRTRNWRKRTTEIFHLDLDNSGELYKPIKVFGRTFSALRSCYERQQRRRITSIYETIYLVMMTIHTILDGWNRSI